MEAQPSKSLGIVLWGRLSLMMFLQYAIWGAWLPLLWPFLNGHRGFTPAQIGHMFAVGAAGAIVAPFIAGQIADRWFSTEKFLGLSHILGGVLIWQLARLEGYWAFMAFSLVYSMLYAPTMPLTNSLAFHHLPDRDRHFGWVRVWGTVGWIAVGWGMAQWLAIAHTPAAGTAEEIQSARFAGMADAFRLSAMLGIAMGVYCFFLPHTPPQKGERRSATAEAMSEIRRQPLITLFLLAVPISCIHQFYFVHTAGFLGAVQARVGADDAVGQWINRAFGAGGGGLMTLGQMSEIAFMAAMPFIAVRLTRKTILALGTIAYALRMAIFAYADALSAATGLSEAVVASVGVAFHGPVFAFWIFLAFMIVDEETTGDVRASAQSLFNLVIVGIGVIVGSNIATGVAGAAMNELGEIDFTFLFAVPMWASVACLVLLLVFYPGGRRVRA
jgi:nucleoside transporter